MRADANGCAGRRATGIVGLVIVALAAVPATPAAASDDPLFSEQWALDKIGAPSAWASSTGAGIRIGIVDSGIDLEHEDLAAKVVAHTSCIGSGGDPAACSGSAQDDVGHGTAVAGIAAALKDNGKGLAGVAPDAELVVAKVASAFQGFSLDDANAGIKWVVDQGAKVVNISLGEASPGQAGPNSILREGIEYAWSRGAVPVVSAGDTGTSYERGDTNALVVGATDRDDQVPSYSSPTGSAKWALVAPGGQFGDNDAQRVRVATWKSGEQNKYGWAAGTSFSAPHVAGAAALLLAQGLSAQVTVDRLLATADTSVSCGPNSPTCPGRLNLARAVGTA